MKKTNPKKRRQITFYLLIFIVLVFISCKKEDAPKNCGCDAETQYTIPNEEFEVIYGIPPEE